MAVLDTFYILFKTDAEDVEKGTKTAKKSVDGLEKSISGADKSSISLGKKFNTLATRAVGAFGAVAAVAAVIATTAKATAGPASDLGVLSDVIGESASEIVNWGRAVENMGGDSKAFEGSLRSLSGSLNDVLINGPNAASLALSKMGISARDADDNMKPLFQILPELAREFSGLRREGALSRGKDLGLDTGTILLLMEGEQAVAALVARQREMNTVSNEEIEQLRRLNVGFNELGNTMSDVVTNAIVGLIPILASADDEFFEFLENTRAGIETASDRWEFFADAVGLVESGVEGVGDGFAFLFELISSNVGNVLELLSSLDVGGFLDDIDAAYKELTNLVIPGVSEIFEGLSLGDFSPNMRDIVNEISAMGSTPLTAVGAGGGGASSSRSSSVSIGELTIETQATDSAGIAAGVTDELQTQLSNAVEQFDDGIAG